MELLHLRIILLAQLISILDVCPNTATIIGTASEGCQPESCSDVRRQPKHCRLHDLLTAFID